MDMLSEDEFLCPSCFNSEHKCVDLFVFQPFGLIACSCDFILCRPIEITRD